MSLDMVDRSGQPRSIREYEAAFDAISAAIVKMDNLMLVPHLIVAREVLAAIIQAMKNRERGR